MGSIDLIVEADLDVHDFMALVPVIEGAGGLVTDWQGAAADPALGRSHRRRRRSASARERAEVAGVNQPLNIGHRSRIGGTAPLYCHHKLGTAPGGDPTMMRFRLPLGLALTLALVAPSWVARPGGARPPTAWRCMAISSMAPTSQHFDYVNPNAPKGGTVTFSAIGSFDSFNPYIIKGEPAVGITLLLREPDHAVAGRAVLRVRPARRKHRDAGGPLLGGVHAQARGALARRQAGDGRGRDLEPGDAAGRRARPSIGTITRT